MGNGFPSGNTVSAVARTPNNLDLFVVGNDGGVHSTYWDASGGWGEWFRIGPEAGFPSGNTVSAVARTPNNLDLFVVGNDGGVHSTYWDASGGWGEWFRIGPEAGFPSGNTVSAVARTPNNLDLFVVGNDGGVHSTYWDASGGWGEWFRIGPEAGFPSGNTVSAVARTPNNLDLFVVGNDGGVHSTYWDASGGWGEWFRIGPEAGFPSGNTVSAVARTPNNLDLFVVGNDGGVHSTYWDASGGWGEWFRIGPEAGFPSGNTVSAVARTPNNLDLFVVGNDGGVHSTYWDASGGWGEWFRIGPEAGFPSGSTVSAVARTPNNLDLFVVGNDGGVHSTYWHGSSWSGWFGIGVHELHPWPMVPLEGYVSKENVRPNEPITVHVRSTVGPFRVQILRRGLSDSVVANVGTYPDAPVEIPFDAPENGCTWPVATAVSVPTGSPSGLYIVRLSSLDGAVTAEIPFVVIAEAPGVRSAILFAIPSSTYEAYNWWGGRSLYGHGEPDGFHWFERAAVRVSPLRPYLGPDDFVTPKLQYWEMPFIRWLETNGVVVDYCTSNELHSNPELLSHYRLIVTVGHDEYWSSEMRDNVEQFAADGGTVGVLSGNSVWWQIRFDDEPAITCYKDWKLDPASGQPAMQPRVTVNWIDRRLGRPETLMTGVSFQYGAMFFGDGVSSAPEFEVMTQHPVLQHTHLEIGDTFGRYADNVGRRPPWKDGWLTVIGYECDARPTPGTWPSQDVLPSDPNWRSNWDSIIPVDLTVGGSPDVLFYDRSLGEGELHRVDASGTVALRRFHQGWRRSWDKIVAGAFGNTGFGGLLFYESGAGLAEFYAIEADGDIGRLQAQDFWRQSWDQIVPGNFGGSGHSDLLLYDRAAGVGEFYATDGSANLALLQSHEGWRQSWDMIVPGGFGGGGNTDLLFYDRGAGVGEFYEVAGGNIAPLQTESGWRRSWDVILPVRLGPDFTALVFYDRSAGTGEIYATDGSGNTSLLKTYLDWRTTWKAIVPLRLADHGTFLLFYEADTGYAEVYSVDADGNLGFVQPYGDRAFMLIARSVFPQQAPDGSEVTREYASMGFLRIGAGQVFSASTTDWSFGLSQSQGHWSVIDQITANLLHLYGSGPRLVRPVSSPEAVDPGPASAELERQWASLRSRPESGQGRGARQE